MNFDNSLLAVAHGTVNTKEAAEIIMFVVNEGEFTENRRLSFHSTGVSDLAFSLDSTQLISVGSQEEKTVVVWNVSSGEVVSSTLIE